MKKAIARIVYFTSIVILVVFAPKLYMTIKAEEELEEKQSRVYNEFNVEQAYEDYNANEVNAKQKYEEKFFFFTGKIDHFDTSFLDEPMIYFEYNHSKEEYQTLQIIAYFEKELADEVAKLNKGDEITLNCTFLYDGRMHSSFSFDECEIRK